MRRRKVDALLVSVQVDLDTIGLKQLHAVLRNKGFESALLYVPDLDPSDESLLEQIVRFVDDLRPGFVGIGLMSHEFSGASAITSRLKKTFADMPVIWGGVHPTIAPQMCLDYADYVCVGEGEHAIEAIAAAIRDGESIQGVPNLCFRRDGLVVRNPIDPPVVDLDSLPFCEHLPASSYIAHKGKIVPLDQRLFRRYGRWGGTVYSIMASRGCPFACSYCCNDFFSRFYDAKKIRRRSVASIISELVIAVRENPQLMYINFQDDCFLACSESYLEQFCLEYRRHVGVPFVARCIPSFVDAKRLAMLKDAGLAWMSLGLQSGSESVLSGIYNRSSGPEQFLAAAKLLNEFKIAVYYDVIVDNPLESDEDRYKTIEVLAKTPRPYFLQMHSLVLYPGTTLYQRVIPDHPELADEYLHKNFYDYVPEPINRMIRLSAYLPGELLRLIVGYSLAGHKRASFRFLLLVACFLSATFFEPLASFRVIKRSQNGDLLKTLKQLPLFYRIGFSRYVKQFSYNIKRIAGRLGAV